MMDSSMIGIAVAVLIILVNIVIYYLYKRSKSVHNDVLLTGLSGSGKTVMFALLVYNKVVNTYISNKENVGSFQSDKGNLNIVDIPGNERLRNKFLTQYKASARALIYVIDSVTFQKEIRDVAEFLYIILSDQSIVSYCRHILVFCNKQDETMAKGKELIKTQLEKELNILRNTKAHQLLSTDGKEEKSYTLGSPGSDFDFSQYPSKVEFAEGYLYNEDATPASNLEPINKWLDKVL